MHIYFRYGDIFHMDYLLEIARIVDGAVKGDRAKVIAYVEQLVRKLREANEDSAADRLVKTLSQTAVSEVAPTFVARPPRLPVDQESRFALADEARLAAGDVHVILDAPIQRQVNEFIRFVKAADRLLANRVGITPSMLIYGPPGVGKTELARFVAAELGLPLITARSDALISSFLGSTAKNLRLLFDHARGRPCVLFLDEFDSVAKLRDDQYELGELKRVVVSLLQNIDALDNQTVLLAATNHEHLLDPAIWRRFAYRVEMKLPGYDARLAMFSQFLYGRTPLDGEVGLIAAISDSLTGADIRRVCECAIRASILDERESVKTVDVLRELVQTRIQDVDLSDTDPEKVSEVQALAPDHMTLKWLAALFNSSESTISRRLNEGGIHARKRKKTADQDSTTPRGRLATSARRRLSP
jgi:hypothetical protein